MRVDYIKVKFQLSVTFLDIDPKNDPYSRFSAYDPTVTEWDLYYWFTEAQPYPAELIKDDSLTADYAHEPIQGVKEMMELIIEHSKNTKREIMLQPELSKKLIHGQ